MKTLHGQESLMTWGCLCMS